VRVDAEDERMGELEALFESAVRESASLPVVPANLQS
jgi:hypothetical protein